LQKDVALRIGIDTDTLCRWERNESSPQIRNLPKIVKFLGYDHSPAPKNLADALLAVRKAHGWSRREAAKIIGLNESTLAKIERGKSRRPAQTTLGKLVAFIERTS
jgi:transcriptional regulator with XRE-family HTH domain